MLSFVVVTVLIFVVVLLFVTVFVNVHPPCTLAITNKNKTKQ